jgi:transcription initiation factor TFIID subunit 13
MEPRARAGKNVGKETFQSKDGECRAFPASMPRFLTRLSPHLVGRLLFAYGDIEHPLPETVRVADEIVTEFLEGICFEASRHAQVAGRQKLKFDDFEFALRHSPEYLGKVRSMIDKRQQLQKMRKTFDQDDAALAKEAEKDNAAAAAAANGAAEDDLLGLSDDDGDIQSTLTSNKGGKKRKRKDKDTGK